MAAALPPRFDPLRALVRRRVGLGYASALGIVGGLAVGAMWESGFPRALLRGQLFALAGYVTFHALGAMPHRLPFGAPRWVVRVGGSISMPIAAFLVYLATTPRGGPPFWTESKDPEGNTFHLESRTYEQ